MQDVSIALLYIRERTNYGTLRHAFEEGYRSIRHWPEEQPGQIETFFVGRLLVFANRLVREQDHEENDFEPIEDRLARYEKEFVRHFISFHLVLEVFIILIALKVFSISRDSSRRGVWGWQWCFYHSLWHLITVPGAMYGIYVDKLNYA